ncbi:MAG: indolepyruvate ferredoxin oxidoreductase family protein [Gammaproteobacteria bacterium]|nr:indolepyruvate ferredoxin oxidoreductase family protein [Gammaproteobacteria bacterium]
MQSNISLGDKYALDAARAYITGVEALVRLPMLQHQRDVEAGLNTAGFVSGYRGSPVGTVDLSLAQARARLDEHNIQFQPGVNEDLAATAVWGTQQAHLLPGAKYDGVFALWYGKGPGVDRSMDVIKHANAFGTTKYGGVLAVAGDDHACKSSTMPHQSEHMFIGADVPVLNPAGVQDVLDYGLYGWALSRYSGCWVGLKAITESMDSAISADLDPARVSIRLPDDFETPPGGLNAQWPTTPLQQEKLLHQYRIYAARAFARVNNLNRVTLDTNNPRLGIVTTGKSYLDVMEALGDLGLDAATASAIGIRIYKVGMSWPLEPVATHQFAKGLAEILVVEEKRGILENQITGQLYNWPVAERPLVIGERDEHGNALVSNLSELSPAMVARAMGSRIMKFHDSDAVRARLEFLDAKEQRLNAATAAPTRVPYFCSGCPHNTSTRVPDNSVGMAGIGCHYMAKWMNRNTEVFTQMGGEGASWIGMAAFTDTAHVFQNIGDGTYFHSGILAVRAAVAARVNITYKVLYNHAVAMTGGQAVDGTLTLAQLAAQLQAEGVSRLAVVAEDVKQARKELRSAGLGRGFERFIRRGLGRGLGRGFGSGGRDGVNGRGDRAITVHARQDFDALQQQFRAIPGTTVIIYDQACATAKRRLRKRGQLPESATRVFINAEVCEGCGDCSATSNCLSVLPKRAELGVKRQIDQSACNADFSCLDGFCPSFVTVTATGGAQLQFHGGDVNDGDSGDGDGGNSGDGDDELERRMETALPEPVVASLERPWNVLVTGIGGTGVLTVGSLLAMAAHIEGKGCSTLNQTGLAQKFGAVVSHVRIANAQDDIHAARIPDGDADLLLGCDLVVSAMPEALARLDSARAHAVVNTHENPTADFIHDPDYRFPAEAMRRLISDETGATKTAFVDATRIARDLLGDSIAANLFLLGFAYQRGLIPVSAEAIAQAIELNNVAVDFNRRAFRWGRRAAVNLDAVERLARDGHEHAADAQPLTKLDDIIDWRYRYLCAYQNTKYADRYRALVEQTRRAEVAMTTGDANYADDKNADDALKLTEAVARGYFKLLAYKDEYEVARLYAGGDFIADLKQQFRGPVKLNFHLAAPLLSRADPLTGHLIKRRFPAATLHAFKLLARLKCLRGTRFDIFGMQSERQRERQLITEYEHDLAQLLPKLTPRNQPAAAAFAALPECIKGFGHIKSANIKTYTARKQELLNKIRAPELTVVSSA